MTFVKIVLIVVSLAAPVFCGFQIGLGTGYGFSAGGHYQEISSTEDAASVQTAREAAFVSLGNGLKLDFEAAFFFNENFGVMLATGYSLLGGYKVEAKDPGESLTGEYESSFIPLNLGIKIKTGLGRVLPYAYVAPGLMFPSVTSTVTGFTNGGKREYTYDYGTGMGIASGMGAAMNLTGRISAKIEFFFHYAFAALNEEKEVITDPSNNSTTVITKYVDKPRNQVLPAVTSGTTTIRENNDMIQKTFSSAGLKLGVMLDF
jgi:hypothetical protein